jgi:class 3 adenylate cyclase/GAF domain-containing protein
MTERASGVVTILFTDLVGSTELLSRAGDEEAQRIFRAHHDLLAEAAAAHGGEEVKWLGDGLMVAFASAADAVNCGIAMQQAARRLLHGERLAIRVGLNAGEAMKEAADYFGLPVVVARRLCDRAEAGQILCTDVVAGLLAGRLGFAFEGLGQLELKGVPHPVTAFEVGYEVQAAQSVASRMPFVGRQAEMRFLGERLAEAAAGRGGLVMVVGEPGIGKTRLAEELTEVARRGGWLALWGRCFEGDWSPPYAPFVEALEADVAARPDEWRAAPSPWAAPVARLVPKVRDVLPDVPEAAPLQADEERFRLLDSVAQLLVARSAQAPVLICLDDLQWADRGTIAMLRHVTRIARRHRILVLGTYRDVEVDRSHPLTDTLRALRREAEYQDVKLAGLAPGGTAELLAALGGHDVPEKVGAAWARETEGNPFFIRELLMHFVEVGKLFRDQDGRWTTERPLRDLGIPPGVKDVVARRLSRLSEAANKILAVAAAFEGPFSFDLVARVSGVAEDEGLDALDEALAAQVVHPTDVADTYVFANTLIRQTVYGELSSSRQVRLHRRVAEALEAAHSWPTPAQSGEIAAQYQRSAGLPGAERGADFAVAAATHAETTGAHDDAARFLRTALELLPDGDNRRPRLLGRLGIALTWAATFDEAVAAAAEAGKAIAATEGEEAAADYLSQAMSSCLDNLERLDALQASGLMDAPPRPDLDRLTSEAAKRLGASYALMTLIDDRRQFFASHYGLPPEVRETPREHSWCKFVAAFDEPLHINNSLTHVLVRDSRGTKESGIRSYLGVPLRTKEGHCLGSFCVADTSTRQWRPEDHEVLEELAAQAMTLAQTKAEEPDAARAVE